MNTIGITLFKIFSILFITTTIIIFVLVVLATLIAGKNSKAIDEIWLNTLHCGKTMCPENVTDLPVPIQPNEAYDPTMALYCADLVYRVTKYALAPLQPPKGLTLVTRLWDMKDKPVFGILWTYQYPKTKKKIAFVILRGTENLREWLQDFNYNQESFTRTQQIKQTKIPFLKDVSIPPNVHAGFLEVYGNFRSTLISHLNELKPDQVLLSGHSLGAGVVTICALDLKLLGFNTIAYTIASPRVGDNTFCNVVESSKLPLYRITNSADMVPTLPPPVDPHFTEPDSPYIYTHCGKLISFTDNWKSYFNNHLMPVYLTFLRLKNTEKK